MIRFKAVQNERSINFLGIGRAFPFHKYAPFQSECKIIWSSIYLEANKQYDFLHRDNYQGKIEFKISTVGWVWPVMSRRSQSYLDLTR